MKTVVTASIFILWLTCHENRASAEEKAQVITRREFAAAMSQLKVGMSHRDVLRLLGEPDDKRTKYDPGGTADQKNEEWRYGTSGHLTTATLGQVFLDDDLTVKSIFGAGKPATEGLPEEKQLCRMLRVLDRVPSYFLHSTNYDPLPVIQAVNILQPLGQRRALAVLEEYLRVTSSRDSGREGMFLVLRVLFEIPDDPGHHPKIFGLLEEEKDMKSWPRFPIVVQDDIPFLAFGSFGLAGGLELPELHLAKYRDAKIRERPLTPTNKPLQALEKLIASARWRIVNKTWHWNDKISRAVLQEQSLRLVNSAFRVKAGLDDARLPWKKPKQRRRILDDFSKLSLRWDPTRNNYTLADGTFLPAPAPRHYRNIFWKIPGYESELIIRRLDPQNVSVALYETAGGVKAKLLVVNTETMIRVAKFKVGVALRGFSPGTGSHSTSGAMIRTREGTPIQAKLMVGKETILSPILRP
ncbi:MAG: hypothetical protein IID44_27455 [Planctomycetes bacterium]|nr:hypothetical protein [Planctomycetota bacterium]